MLKGIAAAALGMMPHLKRQEVLTNNLANVHTAGFKRDRVFVERLDQATQLLDGTGDWGKANRVGLSIDFSSGSLTRTSNPMDAAISGDGFFVVQTPQGEQFTRNGHFSVTADGILSTTDGHAVMGEGGEIKLPSGTITIDTDGTVGVDGRNIDKLRVARFDDPRVLVRAASTLFEIGIPTATPQIDTQSAIRQGYLEDSNVNTIEEMVNMITVFRFYEADQKAIQMQDQIQGRVVSDLGRIPG